MQRHATLLCIRCWCKQFSSSIPELSSYARMSTIAPSSHPRAHLDKSGHTAIDSVLKGLKKSSRSLQVVLAAWSTDSQILDRVYYKGKNQHRGALFWRRVVELRRICGRLRHINPDQKLNVFRTSFFGSDVPRKYAYFNHGSWKCA